MSNKLTIDDVLKLDIADIKRKCYFDDRGTVRGSLSWSRDSECIADISYTLADSKLQLRYSDQLTQGHLVQNIELVTTACNYGGKRYWLYCPDCGKRVRVLYYSGNHFTCRTCSKLLYGCQLEDRVDRLTRRLNKVRGHLNGTGLLGSYSPAKPKWMRWRTYENLLDEEHAIVCSIIYS